jgi:hypothetical protein
LFNARRLFNVAVSFCERDTPDTADTGDTTDTGDTADTADTGDTTDTGDTPVEFAEMYLKH